MKIGFFGNSEVGVPILRQLSVDFKIEFVVTSPDKPAGRKQNLAPTPIKIEAERLSLPIFQPAKVKNNPDFLDHIKKFNCDIFVIVSYGKILPSEVINLPKFKSVNVHFSLLPKYRGPSPIQAALLNGDMETGVSIFILDEQVDHGPILAIHKAEIGMYDNFTTLSEKLSRVSATIISDTLQGCQSGSIIPNPQNHALATVCGMIKKTDGLINFQSMTAGQIFNKFRAYYLWPGIYFESKLGVIKILNCQIAQSDTDRLQSNKLIAECSGKTYLEITELQIAGKNKISARDFLNSKKSLAEVLY